MTDTKKILIARQSLGLQQREGLINQIREKESQNLEIEEICWPEKDSELYKNFRASQEHSRMRSSRTNYSSYLDFAAYLDRGIQNIQSGVRGHDALQMFFVDESRKTYREFVKKVKDNIDRRKPEAIFIDPMVYALRDGIMHPTLNLIDTIIETNPDTLRIGLECGGDIGMYGNNKIFLNHTGPHFVPGSDYQILGNIDAVKREGMYVFNVGKCTDKSQARHAMDQNIDFDDFFGDNALSRTIDFVKENPNPGRNCTSRAWYFSGGV